MISKGQYSKTIKKILEEYLGVKPQPDRKNLGDFKAFCGLWTQDDLAEFENRTSDFRKIDHSDWQ